MMPGTTAPRILFCTDTYPPQVNGVSVVTALSVGGLVRRGWECAVVAPRYPTGKRDAFASDPALREAVETLTIASASLPLYPELRLAAPHARAIAGLIDRFRPDVIHCETEFVLGWLGQRLAIQRGITVTSSYHTDFSRYAEAYGFAWARPAVTAHIARFHRRSARTYTPSEPAARDLCAMGVVDVEVWGRGVDGDLFHARHRSEPLRAAYGRPGTFVFLHVGRLAAEKGVERVIAAFDIVRQHLPAGSVHLIIAGSGPREVHLRAAAPPGVTFLGNLDRHAVLPRLYASCDAFVFASHTETLGLVLLEAMASGLPLVAAPEGGVADLLRDDENGLAYRAGDVGAMAKAMIALALDPGKTRRLAEGARRTAERLSWEQELHRLDDSYRSLWSATPNGQVGDPAIAAA